MYLCLLFVSTFTVLHSEIVAWKDLSDLLIILTGSLLTTVQIKYWPAWRESFTLQSLWIWVDFTIISWHIAVKYPKKGMLFKKKCKKFIGWWKGHILRLASFFPNVSYIAWESWVLWKLIKGQLTDMASGGLQEKLSCPPFLLNLGSHWKRWMLHCFSYFTTNRKKASTFCLPPIAQPIRSTVSGTSGLFQWLFA